MTADDLWRMPDDGYRTELVRGEIVKMAPAGGGHGTVAGRLHMLLAPHVHANKLGVTGIAEAGYTLARSPDSVRAPDVSFVAREHIPPSGVPEGYWQIPPDLAVEVISPSERPDDVQDKVIEYLSAGTRLVWLIYPRTKTVTVYRSLRNIRVLTSNDTLSGEDVVPGFACQVSELFE
ncbi:MAG: Uma2 family endonuclease [Chloroflexota bacterium]